eukprot:scaffold86384_cov37-Prasinocladus_malaysianus.AAC.1
MMALRLHVNGFRSMGHYRSQGARLNGMANCVLLNACPAPPSAGVSTVDFSPARLAMCDFLCYSCYLRRPGASSRRLLGLSDGIVLEFCSTRDYEARTSLLHLKGILTCVPRLWPAAKGNG